MDFKKPERPVEDLDKRFEGTDGVMPQPHPAPTVVKKGMSGIAKVVVILLTVLLMATAGYGVYAYMTEQQLRQRESDLTSRVTTLEGQLEAAGKQQEAEVKPDVATQDNDAIIDMVIAHLKAPVSGADKKAVVSITKQGTEFALASGGFEESEGISYILKKVEDTWIIIFSGQGEVPQTDVTAYAIPDEYIPEPMLQ